MSLPWSKVVPPEIVKRVQKTLLGKNADFFVGSGPSLPGSARYNARKKNNIRQLRRGSISADGKYFYDAVTKKRIKIERAIFEEFIRFEEYYYLDGRIFDEISNKEHGFMLALIPLLNSIDPGKDGKKSLANRLDWLTNNHDPASQVSRNFVDPFFQKVVMDMDEKVKTRLQKIGYL